MSVDDDDEELVVSFDDDLPDIDFGNEEEEPLIVYDDMSVDDDDMLVDDDDMLVDDDDEELVVSFDDEELVVSFDDDIPVDDDDELISQVRKFHQISEEKWNRYDQEFQMILINSYQRNKKKNS